MTAEQERAAVVAFIETTINDALIQLGVNGADNAEQAVSSLGTMKVLAEQIKSGDHHK
jgi:hypothetical protein